MAEPILVWSIFRFRDADGNLVEVETTPDLSRHLESMERAFRRREERTRKHEIPATDLKGRRRRSEAEEPLGLTEDEANRGMARRISGRRQRDNSGNAWQGPRLPVTNIIGVNAIWNGEPGYQEYCQGRRLEPGTYCLDCDRHGSELALPGLTPDERKGLTRPFRPRADGLRGGKGSRPEGDSGKARAPARPMA